MASIRSLFLDKDWKVIFNHLDNENAGKLAKHLFRFLAGQSPTPPDRYIDVAFSMLMPVINRHFCRSGENHWNWKGKSTMVHRIRNSIEMQQWRREVFERDNYTCQETGCGQRGGKLNAHHIKTFANFPELRFDINNGLTLCEKHHRKLHRKHGRQ